MMSQHPTVILGLSFEQNGSKHKRKIKEEELFDKINIENYFKNNSRKIWDRTAKQKQ